MVPTFSKVICLNFYFYYLYLYSVIFIRIKELPFKELDNSYILFMYKTKNKSMSLKPKNCVLIHNENSDTSLRVKNTRILLRFVY